MSNIYFDEHGNTGEFLVDPEQPVFALASNDYSDEEARELLGPLQSQGAKEVKFKTLRKTPGGIARLARFLADPRVNSTRVAAYTVDKRLMVLNKMLDIVLETLMHKMTGIDFNADGANLATSNMLHLTLPVLAGQQNYDALLSAFERLIRRRKPADLQNYLDAGEAVLATDDDKRLREFIGPMFQRELVPLWMDSLPDEDNLNPAETTLFTLIGTWGARKTDRFTVIHDESKPIFRSRDLFLRMMAAEGEQSKRVGYDRRKFLFPLRAQDLQLRPSHEVGQIQIADVCAGAAAYAMRAKLFGLKDELAELVDAMKVLDWVVASVHASLQFTPEELGTDGNDAENSTDVMMRRILD